MSNHAKSDTFSYFSGLLGALLGALIGSIPWFLVSAFANFYVGWLGFLTGVSAFFGYKLLKGARVNWYAMTVTILCSIVAILVSEFCAVWIYLSNDSEWIEVAASFDMSVTSYVFISLLDPENLWMIISGTWIGLLIGVLGIISVRKNIIAYCNTTVLSPTMSGTYEQVDPATPYNNNTYTQYDTTQAQPTPAPETAPEEPAQPAPEATPEDWH